MKKRNTISNKFQKRREKMREHKIEFNTFKLDLNLEINKELNGIADLFLPGIFGVQNVITQRIFITDSKEEEVLFEILFFFENLENGDIKNPDLLLDFKKYGKDSFKFLVFETALEFESKRDFVVSYYQNLYSNMLY